MTEVESADDSVAGVVAFWSVIQVPDDDQLGRVWRPVSWLPAGRHRVTMR